MAVCLLHQIPIAAAVVIISFWRISESRGAVEARVDWWGALLATVGLGGLVNGFIESASLGWRNPLVFGSLIVGLAVLLRSDWSRLTSLRRCFRSRCFNPAASVARTCLRFFSMLR